MKLKTAVLSFALALLTSGTALAETWTCRYDGSWVTAKTGNTATFTWDAVWNGAGTSYKLNGAYTDKLGTAIMDGSCQNNRCWLAWHYTSGSLNGKRYYVGASYTDGAGGLNTITGTWGYSPSNTSDGGAFNAKAICRKQ